MLAENLVDAHKSGENNSAEHHKDAHGDVINEPKEGDVGR